MAERVDNHTRRRCQRAPGPLSTRPGFAPVCFPSRTIIVPFTKTYFTPTDS